MAANYDLELTNSSRRAAPGHVTEKHHFHHFMERPNVIRDVTNCHWYWHTHYGGDHVMVHMATPICQILFPSLNVVLVESHYLALKIRLQRSPHHDPQSNYVGMLPAPGDRRVVEMTGDEENTACQI